MNKDTVGMLNRLHDLGISDADCLALRRISMTLRRWFELECGDGNSHGSWAIERLPVTARRLRKVSSPAQHPQYTMTVKAGAECKQVNSKWVVQDTSKVIGGNEHDLAHYYIWLDDKDVVEKPYMIHHHYLHGRGKDYITRTPIADREEGAKRRLKTIMARYPGLTAYVQTDPRGCSLYILRSHDIPASVDVSSIYNRGVAVYK